MNRNANTIIALLELPLKKWKLKQCIILEWQDAPLEGFCELSSPHICFYFRVFAVKESSNDADSFLYEISVSDDISLLADFNNMFNDTFKPIYPFWNPFLKHRDDMQFNMDDEVQLLIKRFESQPKYLLSSKNMNEFIEIWKLSI